MKQDRNYVTGLYMGRYGGDEEDGGTAWISNNMLAMAEISP